MGVAASLDSALSGSGKPPELSGCTRPRQFRQFLLPRDSPSSSHTARVTARVAAGDRAWGLNMGSHPGTEPGVRVQSHSLGTQQRHGLGHGLGLSLETHCLGVFTPLCSAVPGRLSPPTKTWKSPELPRARLPSGDTRPLL